jgi:type VII secretion effector (TIGR04197 family)
MGEIFKVQTDTLRTLATQLSDSKSGLDSTSASAKDAASHVGSDVLKDALKKFDTDWNARRSKISSTFGNIVETINKVAEEFETVDNDLGKQIASPAK